MPKTSPTKTQATSAAQEPFIVTAQRLGDALADVVAHSACPSDVRHAIEELDSAVFNNCSSLEISLRYSFPALLAGMLDKRRK